MFHSYVSLPKGQFPSCFTTNFPIFPIQTHVTTMFPSCFPFKSTIFPIRNPSNRDRQRTDEVPKHRRALGNQLSGLRGLRKPPTRWAKSEGLKNKKHVKIEKNLYKSVLNGRIIKLNGGLNRGKQIINHRTKWRLTKNITDHRRTKWGFPCFPAIHVWFAEGKNGDVTSRLSPQWGCNEHV